MIRVAVLVIAVVSSSSSLAVGQEEGSVLGIRCLNCEDPELLAWLQPLDPEVPRFTCSLRMALTIEADGAVAEAYPLEEELPSLCERRATLWAGATRWSVDRGPVSVNLPLEFEIQQTIDPTCIEGCDAQRAFAELRRVGAIRAGVSCETTLGLLIDTEGRVIAVSVLDGDRDPACVRGMSRWARGMRWSTAYEKGEPSTTLFPQTFRIQTR